MQENLMRLRSRQKHYEVRLFLFFSFGQKPLNIMYSKLRSTKLFFGDFSCKVLENIKFYFVIWIYNAREYVFFLALKIFISEWRRETRREASRRSTQRASCHSHTWKHNNIITGEILILAMWCIEQKVILFRCRTDIRDEPARPEPARPHIGQ